MKIDRLLKAMKSANKRKKINITLATVIMFLLGNWGAYGSEYVSLKNLLAKNSPEEYGYFYSLEETPSLLDEKIELKEEKTKKIESKKVLAAAVEPRNKIAEGSGNTIYTDLTFDLNNSNYFFNGTSISTSNSYGSITIENSKSDTHSFINAGTIGKIVLGDVDQNNFKKPIINRGYIYQNSGDFLITEKGTTSNLKNRIVNNGVMSVGGNSTSIYGDVRNTSISKLINNGILIGKQLYSGTSPLVSPIVMNYGITLITSIRSNMIAFAYTSEDFMWNTSMKITDSTYEPPYDIAGDELKVIETTVYNWKDGKYTKETENVTVNLVNGEISFLVPGHLIATLSNVTGTASIDGGTWKDSNINTIGNIVIDLKEEFNATNTVISSVKTDGTIQTAITAKNEVPIILDTSVVNGHIDLANDSHKDTLTLKNNTTINGDINFGSEDDILYLAGKVNLNGETANMGAGDDTLSVKKDTILELRKNQDDTQATFLDGKEGTDKIKIEDVVNVSENNTDEKFINDLVVKVKNFENVELSDGDDNISIEYFTDDIIEEMQKNNSNLKILGGEGADSLVYKTDITKEEEKDAIKNNTTIFEGFENLKLNGMTNHLIFSKAYNDHFSFVSEKVILNPDGDNQFILEGGATGEYSLEKFENLNLVLVRELTGTQNINITNTEALPVTMTGELALNTIAVDTTGKISLEDAQGGATINSSNNQTLVLNSTSGSKGDYVLQGFDEFEIENGNKDSINIFGVDKIKITGNVIDGNYSLSGGDTSKKELTVTGKVNVGATVLGVDNLVINSNASLDSSDITLNMDSVKNIAINSFNGDKDNNKLTINTIGSNREIETNITGAVVQGQITFIGGMVDDVNISERTQGELTIKDESSSDKMNILASKNMGGVLEVINGKLTLDGVIASNGLSISASDTSNNSNDIKMTGNTSGKYIIKNNLGNLIVENTTGTDVTLSGDKDNSTNKIKDSKFEMTGDTSGDFNIEYGNILIDGLANGSKDLNINFSAATGTDDGKVAITGTNSGSVSLKDGDKIHSITIGNETNKTTTTGNDGLVINTSKDVLVTGDVSGKYSGMNGEIVLDNVNKDGNAVNNTLEIAAGKNDYIKITNGIGGTVKTDGNIEFVGNVSTNLDKATIFDTSENIYIDNGVTSNGAYATTNGNFILQDVETDGGELILVSNQDITMNGSLEGMFVINKTGNSGEQSPGTGNIIIGKKEPQGVYFKSVVGKGVELQTDNNVEMTNQVSGTFTIALNDKNSELKLNGVDTTEQGGTNNLEIELSGTGKNIVITGTNSKGTFNITDSEANLTIRDSYSDSSNQVTLNVAEGKEILITSDGGSNKGTYITNNGQFRIEDANFGEGITLSSSKEILVTGKSSGDLTSQNSDVKISGVSESYISVKAGNKNVLVTGNITSSGNNNGVDVWEAGKIIVEDANFISKEENSIYTIAAVDNDKNIELGKKLSGTVALSTGGEIILNNVTGTTDKGITLDVQKVANDTVTLKGNNQGIISLNKNAKIDGSAEATTLSNLTLNLTDGTNKNLDITGSVDGTLALGTGNVQIEDINTASNKLVLNLDGNDEAAKLTGTAKGTVEIVNGSLVVTDANATETMNIGADSITIGGATTGTYNVSKGTTTLSGSTGELTVNVGTDKTVNITGDNNGGKLTTDGSIKVSNSTNNSITLLAGNGENIVFNEKIGGEFNIERGNININGVTETASEVKLKFDQNNNNSINILGVNKGSFSTDKGLFVIEGAESGTSITLNSDLTDGSAIAKMTGANEGTFNLSGKNIDIDALGSGSAVTITDAGKATVKNDSQGRITLAGNTNIVFNALNNSNAITITGTTTGDMTVTGSNQGRINFESITEELQIKETKNDTNLNITGLAKAEMTSDVAGTFKFDNAIGTLTVNNAAGDNATATGEGKGSIAFTGGNNGIFNFENFAGMNIAGSNTGTLNLTDVEGIKVAGTTAGTDLAFNTNKDITMSGTDINGKFTVDGGGAVRFESGVTFGTDTTIIGKSASNPLKIVIEQQGNHSAGGTFTLGDLTYDEGTKKLTFTTTNGNPFVDGYKYLVEGNIQLNVSGIKVNEITNDCNIEIGTSLSFLNNIEFTDSYGITIPAILKFDDTKTKIGIKSWQEICGDKFDPDNDTLKSLEDKYNHLVLNWNKGTVAGNIADGIFDSWNAEQIVDGIIGAQTEYRFVSANDGQGNQITYNNVIYTDFDDKNNGQSIIIETDQREYNKPNKNTNLLINNIATSKDIDIKVSGGTTNNIALNGNINTGNILLDNATVGVTLSIIGDGAKATNSHTVASIQGGSNDKNNTILLENIFVGTDSSDDSTRGDITLGDGKNTLTLTNVTGGNITLGDGGKIEVTTGGKSNYAPNLVLNNSDVKDIALGSGADLVQITGGKTENINLDAGDNQLTIGGTIVSGTITTTVGNDNINIVGTTVTGEINLGDGDNILVIGAAQDGVTKSDIISQIGDTITLGAGNDLVQIINGSSTKEIVLGDGENTLQADKGTIDGSITSGTDRGIIQLDNSSTVKGNIILGDGTIKIADAPTTDDGNFISVNNSTVGGKIEVKNGEESLIQISSASNTGDIISTAGKNTIKIFGGEITKNGDTTTGNRSIVGNIETGNETDNIILNESDIRNTGTIKLGAGENTLLMTNSTSGDISSEGKTQILLEGKSEAGDIVISANKVSPIDADAPNENKDGNIIQIDHSTAGNISSTRTTDNYLTMFNGSIAGDITLTGGGKNTVLISGITEISPTADGGTENGISKVGNITLGNKDDYVQLLNAEVKKIALGDAGTGEDEGNILIGNNSKIDGSITGGIGKDIVTLTAVKENGNIELSNGENILAIEGGYNPSTRAEDVAVDINGNIILGKDKDTVQLQNTYIDGTVELGEGENILSAIASNITGIITGDSSVKNIVLLSSGTTARDIELKAGNGGNPTPIADSVDPNTENRNIISVTGNSKAGNITSTGVLTDNLGTYIQVIGTDSKVEDITLGAGKDKLVFSQSTAGDIALGAGEDTIDGYEVTLGAISGTGKTTIKIGSEAITTAEGGEETFKSTIKSIALGTGDDKVEIFDITKVEEGIALGDGDNTLTMKGSFDSLKRITQRSTVGKGITLGTGNDVVSLAMVYVGDAINLGDGNNTLTISNGNVEDIVSTSPSLNTVTITDGEIGGKIQLNGTGGSKLNVEGVQQYFGEQTIRVNIAEGIELGTGADTVTLANVNIEDGGIVFSNSDSTNGDTGTVTNSTVKGNITFANGDNTLTLTTTETNGNISSGTGEDTFTFNDIVSFHKLDAGAGNDIINIDTLNKITMGDGTVTTADTNDKLLIGGAGEDTINITSLGDVSTRGAQLGFSELLNKMSGIDKVVVTNTDKPLLISNVDIDGNGDANSGLLTIENAGGRVKMTEDVKGNYKFDLENGTLEIYNINKDSNFVTYDAKKVELHDKINSVVKLYGTSTDPIEIRIAGELSNDRAQAVFGDQAHIELEEGKTASGGLDPTYTRSADVYIEAKNSVGEKVAATIKAGDLVYIDGTRNSDHPHEREVHFEDHNSPFENGKYTIKKGYLLLGLSGIKFDSMQDTLKIQTHGTKITFDGAETGWTLPAFLKADNVAAGTTISIKSWDELYGDSDTTLDHVGKGRYEQMVFAYGGKDNKAEEAITTAMNKWDINSIKNYLVSDNNPHYAFVSDTGTYEDVILGVEITDSAVKYLPDKDIEITTTTDKATLDKNDSSLLNTNLTLNTVVSVKDIVVKLTGGDTNSITMGEKVNIGKIRYEGTTVDTDLNISGESGSYIGSITADATTKGNFSINLSNVRVNGEENKETKEIGLGDIDLSQKTAGDNKIALTNVALNKVHTGIGDDILDIDTNTSFNILDGGKGENILNIGMGAKAIDEEESGKPDNLYLLKGEINNFKEINLGKTIELARETRFNVTSQPDDSVDKNVDALAESSTDGKTTIKMGNNDLYIVVDGGNEENFEDRDHALYDNDTLVVDNSGEGMLMLDITKLNKTAYFMIEDTNILDKSQDKVQSASSAHYVEWDEEMKAFKCVVNYHTFEDDLRYKYADKIYKSIINAGKIELMSPTTYLGNKGGTGESHDNELAKEESIREQLMFYGKIYHSSPYAYSNDISKKASQMITNSLMDNRFRAEEGKWIAYGSIAGKGADNRDSFYGKGYYGKADIGRAESSIDIDLNGAYVLEEYGFAPNAAVGFAVGGTKSSTHIGESKLEGSSWYVGSYVKQDINNLRLTAGMAFSHGYYDADRVVSNNYQRSDTSKKYNDNTLSLYAGARYSYKLSDTVSLEPNARLIATHTMQEDINETDRGDLSVEVEKQDFTSVDSEIGMDIAKTIEVEKGTVVLHAGGSLMYSIDGYEDEHLTAKITGSTSNFDMLSVGEERDRFKLSVGAEFQHNNGTIYNVKGNYIESSRGDEYNIEFGIGYKF